MQHTMIKKVDPHNKGWIDSSHLATQLQVYQRTNSGVGVSTFLELINKRFDWNKMLRKKEDGQKKEQKGREKNSSQSIMRQRSSCALLHTRKCGTGYNIQISSLSHTHSTVSFNQSTGMFEWACNTTFHSYFVLFKLRGSTVISQHT